MASEDLDPVDALTGVVEPCVRELLRVGEIERLALGYEERQSLVMPDVPSVDGLTIVPLERAQRRWERRLVLSMTMNGEDFEFVFWPIRRNDPYPQTDVENQRNALFESLQDFIAQSKFGWGQFRG
jgi:hypothetical protein